MRFEAHMFPPALAVALDATTPDPGAPGAVLWSTAVGALLAWDGTKWKLAVAAPSGDRPIVEIASASYTATLDDLQRVVSFTAGPAGPTMLVANDSVVPWPSGATLVGLGRAGSPAWGNASFVADTGVTIIDPNNLSTPTPVIVRATQVPSALKRIAANTWLYLRAAPFASGTAGSTVGDANSAGTAYTGAHSDHTHAHGSQTNPAHHALATTSTAGFMSAADKAKLDLL